MYEITDMDLVELSLVDKPANPMAKVSIFKKEQDMPEISKANKDRMREMGLDEDQMKRMQEEMDKGTGFDDALSKLGLKKSDDLEKTLENLKKSLDTLGYDVAEDGTVTKREEPEYVDVGGSKVEKSAIPEGVLKDIEKANARLAELEKREEKARFEKMADSVLPNTKGTVEQRARIVKAFEDDKEIIEILRAADKLFQDQFKEVGKTEDSASEATPEDKLAKLAKDHASEKSVSFAKAYDDVLNTDEGRDLFKQINGYN